MDTSPTPLNDNSSTGTYLHFYACPCYSLFIHASIFVVLFSLPSFCFLNYHLISPLTIYSTSFPYRVFLLLFGMSLFYQMLTKSLQRVRSYKKRAWLSALFYSCESICYANIFKCTTTIQSPIQDPCRFY